MKYTLKDKMLTLIILLSFVFAPCIINAKIVLPSIFSNNMVLQQNSNVLFRGIGDTSTKIDLKPSWSTVTYQTETDMEGAWELYVPTPMAGGPYSISIYNNEDTLILNNILVGEVWFCSGQSNMEMPMSGFGFQPVKDGNDFIVSAQKSIPIRMFNTDWKNEKLNYQFSKTPQQDCEGEWWENIPENVAYTSAVAYHFANYLYKTLNLPVGIIVSSRGGSTIEAWMSEDATKEFKEIDTSILHNDDEIKNHRNTPCVLYNGKIAPFINFPIKGIIWYQGESNRGKPSLYERELPVFVKDLRKKWNQENMPFYFVEIAPYKYENPNGAAAAYLREAQQNCMKIIPNTGMVTTLDVGDLNIIHPSEKEIVGKRLALWALGQTYGIKGFRYTTPTYHSMEIKDNRIYIKIDNSPGGVYPVGVSLKGFEIAGPDKVFYTAYAEIDEKNKKLYVTSPQVKKPQAVRYAFKNYSQASVYSVYGIPLAPFRTDDW